MNLRSLRVFVGLIETGTLRAAATRMNLSQSAASRLIGLLEQELAAVLFLRENRRMVPTAAADALYPEAQRILGQIEALPLVVADAKSPPMLRVICHPRLADGLVLPAIASFARSGSHDAPERAVRLETAPRRELWRRILSARHDLAVATLPLPGGKPPDLVLGSVPLGVLLPRNHRLASAPVLDLADLADEPYIALDETTVIRGVVDAALKERGTVLRRAHEVLTGASAYRLVAAGLGFTFADRIAVDPLLADGVVLVPWAIDVRISIGIFRLSQDRRDEMGQFERALTEAFAS